MNMHLVKARAAGGHLVADRPADLPEGAEVEVAVVDPGDTLDARDRARLDDALDASWAQARAGQSRPADELLARLRARR